MKKNIEFLDEALYCNHCGKEISNKEVSLYKGNCSECARLKKLEKSRRYVRKRNYEEETYEEE